MLRLNLFHVSKRSPRCFWYSRFHSINEPAMYSHIKKTYVTVIHILKKANCSIFVVVVLVYIFPFALTLCFQDLCKYEYDKIVVKSMDLIKRFYTNYEDLFAKTVDAQVYVILYLIFDILSLVLFMEICIFINRGCVCMSKNNICFVQLNEA